MPRCRMGKRILSVGQCSPDGSAITAFLEQTFAAEVETADTADEAMSSIHNGPFDLVLINRIFDADGGSGLELIRSIKKDSGICKVPVMLVSNLADAQERAVAAGAEPGFGKAQVGTPEAIARLEDLLLEE